MGKMNPNSPQQNDESPFLAWGAGLGELTGKQIGRYLVGERIGSGGAATVYQAFDQVQGSTVALKVLLPSADEKSLSRFQREATTAGGLRHPNIVRVLQVGVAPRGEVAYIAMELIEGESLADLLGRVGTLSEGDAATLLAPIARALDFAHKRGIVHRDVKPSNILLRPVRRETPGAVQVEALGYPVIPLLTDFGIARSLDAPELTTAGRTVGTPAYMAPEQASGSREIDGRADIYALGTVLYRALVGRLPFNGSATQILHAHVYEALMIDSSVLARLQPEMVAVLRRSLAKSPADRYPTAGPMADVLQRVAELDLANAATDTHQDVTATMAVPTVRSQGPRTNNPLVTRREEAPVTPPTGAAVLVPGVAGNGPPDAPTDAYAPDDEGGESRRPIWIWASAAALLVLAVGLVYGIVTWSNRGGDGGVDGDVSIVPTGLPPSVTPSSTPGGPTPTGDSALFPLQTISATATIPTATSTPVPLSTPLPTFALPATSTNTPVLVQLTWTPSITPTPTETPTETPTWFATEFPTNTPSWTPLPIFTDAPPTNTPTWTPIPTDTPSPTLAPATATPTWTTEPATATPEPSDTPTRTPTRTPTETPTETPAETPTEPATETPTEMPTETPEQEPTETPTEDGGEQPDDEVTETPTTESTTEPTTEPEDDETPAQTPDGATTGTPSGTPSATQQPSVTGTPTITATVTGTITATVTGTITTTLTLTPEPPTDGTPTGEASDEETPEPQARAPLPPDCSIAIDPIIEAWLLAQDPAEVEGYECAALPAESNIAEVLPFERGYMASLAGEEGIVVYDENEVWEIHNPDDELGDHAPDPDDAPEGLFAPQGVWREVWRQPLVFDSIGWALESAAQGFDVTQQRFPEGLLVVDPATGEVFKIPIP